MTVVTIDTCEHLPFSLIFPLPEGLSELKQNLTEIAGIIFFLQNNKVLESRDLKFMEIYCRTEATRVLIMAFHAHTS